MSFSSGSGSTARNKQYNNNKSKSSFDDRELDITKEEFSRIREALDKEEFRKLFFDYVEEIQDPENRKLYEQEITQFEKERGVQVTFIHPQPGFVVKTSIDGELKCFINIASSSEIATPKQEVALNPETGERGMSWSIPLAQTPGRDDLDAKNKRCKVFDVVFHPNALHLSKKNNEFRKCLIDTALDAVEREFHVKLDRTNLKYPKMDFKGIARPTVIRKLNENATAEQLEPHPLDNVSPAKPTAESGKPKVLPMKTKATPQPEFTVPNYVIKHCRDVDLSEHTYELDAKMNSTVPRSLVVEIELPLLKSTAECQLDVTSKSIYLLSERAGAKYRLKLDLPYEVDDKEGNARFNTDERRLCITLPVVRSNPTKERELHDVLRNLSREDSGVELHSNSESPVEEEEEEDEDEDEETELSELTDEQGKLLVQSDDSATTTPTVTPMQSPRKFLKDSIHYQFPPKFDCNVLDNVMSFVLHVRNVQSDSIVTLKQSQSLHLQFASIGSGCYPTYYAFYVQLPPQEQPINNGIELKIESAEAEAWENNLILNINLNASSEQIKNYLAGPDSNDLKEYTMFSKSHHGKKDRSISKSPADDLNVYVELKNQINSIDIVIKTAAAAAAGKESSGHSNCATTDEDDEAAQRKQSKKQRKRNKKRRSLSESACDDLKVLEELHQEVSKQQKKQQQQKHHQHQNHQHQHQHQQEKKDASSDLNDEDSSPERNDAVGVHFIPKVRKQRSYSECHDSSINGSNSVGSGHHKSILKRCSRYGPRPSISDSCSSMDECNSSSYSRSVDASFHGFSQSFGGIPEEGRGDGDDAGLSESCKKTVRFNDQIMKQVFRLDSSILGQRKKNQKRRDRKLRAIQRRLSEGDSADYDETDNQKPTNAADYFKNGNNNKKSAQHDSGLDLANNNEKGGKEGNSNKMLNKKQQQHESDTETNKNSMMFEMDDDDDDDEDEDDDM